MRDAIDQRLLDEFQRDFPLVSRPFECIASTLGVSETEVIERLRRLKADGMITRAGATVRPNTVGASTLAALAIPDERIEEVAALVAAVPGVNHAYLREDDWNFWFVATAPTPHALASSLQRIGQTSGLPVLDLPLLRPFNIDLGFRLSGPRQVLRSGDAPDAAILRSDDRPLLQAMTEGLPLTTRPFAAIAGCLQRTEQDVIDRLAALHSAGIVSRIGVIVRHRAIGWRSNAMVVWDLPEDDIEAAGLRLAGLPGVTLCYQRRTIPGVWPFGLFCMIHARSRADAQSVLDEAVAQPELAGARHRALYSTRCFKQTGALVHSEGIAA